jgi:hypothetical protein
MTPERIERFERVFGKANWDIKFKHHLSNTSVIPTLHIIVLNSLNLDTPVISGELQSATYDFINKDVITKSSPVEDRSTFTILLTHLPLHKPAGVCVDAPFFDFYDGHHGGGIKEQNHLSLHVSSQGILEGIFGMSANTDTAAGGEGRKGVILTGHDHEGCDVWHYVPSVFPAEGEEGYHPEQHEKPWRSCRYAERNASKGNTGIREVTLRSMMGSYGGNAGLFSAWFDTEIGEWQFEIQMCAFGVQHWWWGIHVLDLITIIVVGVWTVLEIGSLVGQETIRVEIAGVDGTKGSGFALDGSKTSRKNLKETKREPIGQESVRKKRRKD